MGRSQIPEVVHVSPLSFGRSGVWGGGERYPLELARALSRLVSTRLITFGAHHRSHMDDQLEVTTLKSYGCWRGSVINPLAPALPRAIGRAGLVHAHHYYSTATNLALLLKRFRRQQVVCTDHGGGGKDLSRTLRLDGGLDQLLAVSAFSAERFPQFSDRTRLIYGGVDVTRYFPTQDPREPSALFVGRLLPHKGIDLLIDALEGDTPLRIIGRAYDQAYLSELQRRAAGKTVTFDLSATDEDVITAIRRASVVVLPSLQNPRFGPPAPYSELLGLVLLEAMACGTPVVASRMGGIPEIVPDGEVGLVFQQGNVEELRSQISTLIADRSMWKRMSAAAVSHVREQFTWRHVAERCLAAYSSRRSDLR